MYGDQVRPASDGAACTTVTLGPRADSQADHRLAFGKTFCSDPAALARVAAANG
jgi:hypothetical protein